LIYENDYGIKEMKAQIDAASSGASERKMRNLLIEHLSIAQRWICPFLLVVGLVFTTQPAVSQDIPFQVHFIDVGQGDSILIQAPDGTTALIDGGNANGEALAYLQSLGVQHITAIIATHPHADHIGGLIDVMNALPVDAIWTSGAIHTTGIYERFLDAIDTHQIPYFEAAANDTITVGSLNFDVVYGQESSSNFNNTSLVLHLVYGQVSFLFTGDAEISAEKDMISTVGPIRLNSTVLKVGHHGSSTSSSPEFLNVVRPQIAIYSAGSGNAYGHPHSQTSDNLLAVGALIYGTDDDGTVIVETKSQPCRPVLLYVTIRLGQIGTAAILIPTTKRRHSSSPQVARNATPTGSMGIMTELPARVCLEGRMRLMQSLVIDRFEGEYAVLFIPGSDQSLSVLRDTLPEGVDEGDYLRIEFEDGQIIQVERDEEATEAARRRIQAKRDRLRRGDHLSNRDPE
jgi:beta-lactamase superfamily II metal-dependent hydrolase